MKLIHKLTNSLLISALILSGCSSNIDTPKESEDEIDIYSAEYAGAREEGTSKDDSGDTYYSVEYVKKYQFPKIEQNNLKEDSIDLDNKLSKDSKSIIDRNLSTDVSKSVLNFATQLIVNAGQDVTDYVVSSIYSLDTMCQVNLSNDKQVFNVCGIIPEAGSTEVQIVYTIQQYVID